MWQTLNHVGVSYEEKVLFIQLRSIDFTRKRSQGQEEEGKGAKKEVRAQCVRSQT